MGFNIDFSFEVGNEEKHKVDFHWGQLFGRVRITVDDVEVMAKNQALHWRTKLIRQFEFTVGRDDKHDVLIEKKTKHILGGARKQTCQAFVDGELVGTY